MIRATIFCLQLFLYSKLIAQEHKIHQEKEWNDFYYLFSAEYLRGNYTGISSLIGDDSYSVRNEVIFRIEDLSNTHNYFCNLSFLPLIIDFTTYKALTPSNLKFNDITKTNNYFHTFRNVEIFSFAYFKQLNSENNFLQYAIGGHYRIRVLGIEKTKAVSSDRFVSRGPLMLSGRHCFGPNFHLIKRINKNFYNRLSLYTDYDIGPVKGFNISPSYNLMTKFKSIGLFFIFNYEYSLFQGIKKISYETTPLYTDVSIHQSFSMQCGISFSFDKLKSKP